MDKAQRRFIQDMMRNEEVITALAPIVLKKKEMARFSAGADFDLVAGRVMQAIDRVNAIVGVFEASREDTAAQ